MMEPLDIENNEDFTLYLADTGLLAAKTYVRMKVLPGGVSGRTVLVEWPDGRGRVFKQALPKLRVAVDWFSDPVRVHREALGLSRLASLAPPHSVPGLMFEDRAYHVIGMEAVPRPHENWKTRLLAGHLESDLVRQFAVWLGRVHRQSWLQRDELATLFEDRAFFEALRIEPYYQYTASQVPEAKSFLDELVSQTRARRFALVHGDYSPKNVLVHKGRLVVLDFEVIHWGDPAFDLGFGLTHLLSKAHHLKPHREAFAGAAIEFFRSYRDELGDVPWAGDLEAHAVNNTLGCLLARVAGRSPLEYLDAAARARQRKAIIGLLAEPPSSVPQLAGTFLDRLETA
jgi:5-methylthioribose kinase